ncbi:hypothetical protein [Streptomyces sp. S465]|uniref:hypothetical protein n=1 Tax=Streptomyces sp. S465 TaxID=2979468 RepID=UPI0022A89390|nr:hypothetical protein [Streptomyces sp. S465]WAP54468.1 hypothetical protein N6H00_05420 [Streptomyces sp. S465]
MCRTSAETAEQSLDELLRATHEASPVELPVALDRYAEAMGTGHAVIYLVGLEQRLLMPIEEDVSRLELDDSLAGLAFRTDSVRIEDEDAGGLSVWLPLMNGAERLGVQLRMDSPDGLRLWRCRTPASLLALIITSKRTSIDSFAQRTRTRSMELPTEMVRAAGRCSMTPPTPPPAASGRNPSPGAPGLATATVDDHGVVTGWSEDARRLLDYRAEEVVGRAAAELRAERTAGNAGPGNCSPGVSRRRSSPPS